MLTPLDHFLPLFIFIKPGTNPSRLVYNIPKRNALQKDSIYNKDINIFGKILTTYLDARGYQKMIETGAKIQDRYKLIMDIYEANEKLNERADDNATALLTFSGAITSVAILLLSTDYVAANVTFRISLGILIFFSFLSMLFLVHAIRPFYRTRTINIESTGILFYKDIIQYETPIGYKERVDEVEEDLNKFLDHLSLETFRIAHIIKRKFNNLDRAVSSIFLGFVLLAISTLIGQVL